MTQTPAPAPLPPEEIERLNGLVEKALPGPWLIDDDWHKDGILAPDAEHPHEPWVVANTTGYCGYGHDFKDDNRALIIAAVNALPALLAEIEAGRAGAERVRAMTEALSYIGSGYYAAKDAPKILDEFVTLAREALAGSDAALRQAAQSAPDMIQQHEKQLADWVDAHPVFGPAHGAYTASKAAQPADGAQARPKWQPIETVPDEIKRDRTPVLVRATKVLSPQTRRKVPIVAVDFWHSHDRDGFEGWGHFNPTYYPATEWMSIPGDDA